MVFKYSIYLSWKKKTQKLKNIYTKITIVPKLEFTLYF